MYVFMQNCLNKQLLCPSNSMISNSNGDSKNCPVILMNLGLKQQYIVANVHTKVAKSGVNVGFAR